MKEKLKMIYTKHKIDFLLLFLCLFTFLVWTFDFLNPMLYLLIFIYFIIKKKPYSWYIIVIIFSIPSYHFDSFYLADYLLTVILFVIILIKQIKQKHFQWGKIGVFLAIYTLYALISILWAGDKSWSLIGWGTLIEGIIAYFIVINGDFKILKKDLITISKVATYFMVTITLELIYYFATNDYINIITHKDINLSWGISNYVAVFFVIAIPIALYKYTIKDKFYPVYFFIDLLSMVGLIMTLSRGAYLGAFIGVLIFLIFNLSFKMITKYGLLGIFTLVVLYLSQYSHKVINTIIHDFPIKNLLDDRSRFEIWNFGLEAFKDSPIFGNGYYAARFILRNYGLKNRWFHNLFVDVGVNLGVIGLILILIILFKILLTVFKPKEAFLMSVLAALIGSLTHCFFDIGFNFWTYGLVMYITVGIAELYLNNKNNFNNLSKKDC